MTTAGITTAASSNFQVTPAAAASLSVTGFPTPDTAGAAHSFTVTALDAFGNVATSYLGTAGLISTDGQATFLPTTYHFTNADNGVHTFSGTLRTAGVQSITATDQASASITGSETGILVNPAAPSSLIVTVLYPSPTVAGVSHTFTVTAIDTYGNVATNYTGTVSLLSSDPQAVFTTPTYTFTSGVGAGFDNGVHTFTGTLETVGTQVIQVTDVAHSLSATQTGIVVTVAAPSKLGFVAQPANPSTAGVALDTPTGVKVAIEDFYGNVETTDNSTVVTISVGSGPGGFTGSTLTATAVNGVATFPNLVLDTAGTYTLTATDSTTPSITAGASQSFVVNPNIATQLAVATEPSATATAGVAFATQPVVKEEDQFGNVIATDSTNTVTAATGTSGTGVLQGILTVTLNHGVATFTGLSYDVAQAMNIKFSTTAGAFTVLSSPNTVVSTNVAFQLAVTLQPSAAATAGIAFAAQPTVAEEDQFGNIITTDSTNTVTAARGNVGTGALARHLAHQVTLVNGVATFPASDLTYDVAETMNLRFTSNLGAVAATTSNSIVVSPNVATQLVVTQQPSVTVVAGVAFPTQPVVKEEDLYGNVITSDSTHTVTAATGTQGTAVLQGGSLTRTLVNGVATFPAGDLFYNVAQTMNITFSTNAGGFTTTSNNIVVSPAAANYFLATSPATTNAGSPFSLTVTVYDVFNNVVVGYTGTVHFTSSDTGANSPTHPTLPANYTFTVGVGAGFDDGVHTFTNGVTLVTAGPQTVTVTDTTAAPTVTGTANITVNAIAATHLAITTGSTQAIATPFTATVTAEDPFNNASASFTDTVHFTTSDNGVGVVLPADYTFTAADAGQHVFTNGFTLVSAGSQSITVTDVTAPVITAASVTITMSSANVQVQPISLPNPQVGVAYSQTISTLGGTGGNGTYTLTLLSGTLPTGLTFPTVMNTTSGLLSGTPTAGGTYTFTIQSTSSVFQQGSRVYSLTVAPPTLTMTPTSLSNAQDGVPFSTTFVASGGTAAYTYSALTGSGSAPFNTIPAGITLNPNTGLFSGTPTATGTFNFSIKEVDHSTGTGPYSLTQNYTWTITPPTLVISPTGASLPAGQVGVAYSQTVSGSGGTAAYSFAITFGQLPSGLSLSTGGVISGTPTAGGPYAITVKMTDSTTGAGPYSTTINYALNISAPTLSFAAQPNAQVGAAYSQSVVGVGGTAPYRLFSFGIGTGSAPFNTMPAGLSLSTSGLISGTPTAGGSFNIAITATDSSTGSGPYTFTQNITLVVTQPSITFTPNPMPAATDAVFYSQALTAAGSTAPYSNFVVHSGNLPTGLSLSSSGVISGTPTEGGTFNFVIWTTDSSTGNGPYSTGQNVSLTVNAPTFVFSPASATLTPAQVGVSGYSDTFSVTGGIAPYGNFFIVNGTGSAPFNTLPVGMALSPGGVLQGTPTAAGTYNFFVQANDSSLAANGGHGPYTEVSSQNYSIVVTAPTITLSPASLSNAQVGVNYNQTLTGSGGTAPYHNFTISTSALPPGMTISSSGTISGIPTGGGTYNFTVQTTDSSTGTGPFTYAQAYALTVTPPTITFTPASLAQGQVGVNYNQALTGVGGTAPYGNYIVTAGALPAGMSLSLSGVISGVPTAGGTFNFTIQAADSSTGVIPYPVPPHYTGSQSFSVTINPPAFVFTPNSLTTAAQVGVPYSQGITVAGGTAPYGNFIVSAGTGSAPYNTIPGGLTLNPSTGLLSGTPTATGTFNFTIKATDSSTGSGPFTQGQTYNLVVGNPVLVFSPTTLTGGQAGVNYSQQFVITGGSAPYHNFTITAGSLPVDVNLSGSGLLSGAPGAVGTFSFTVQGTDSSTGGGPYSISQSFIWTIAAPSIVLSPATLPAAQVGVVYSQQVVGSAGTAPYHNFTIVGGALPTGLTLSNTGLISGTPAEGGNFSVQMQALDSTVGPGAPYGAMLISTLQVTPPNIAIAPASLSAAQVGVGYSQTLSASGGKAPYPVFQFNPGAVPPGLTLSIRGVVSGTPTAGGTFSFTVQTTDSSTGSGPFAGSQTYSNFVVTGPAFVFTPTTMPAGQVGASYNQTISVTGGTAPYGNFVVTAGSLPPGLTLSHAGVVSGTPTANGSFTFTVQASDSSTGTGPYTQGQAISLTVSTPTFVFSPATLPAAQVGAPFSQSITVTGGTAPYGNFVVTTGTGSAPYNTLPAGLTLNPSTGLLSGTPTAGGAYNFNISATDRSGGTGPFTQSIHYALTVAAPAFVFSPSSLSAGQAGVAFSEPITITGGTAPYGNFVVANGAGSAPFNTLPAGVTLSPSGLLSGTPTATGVFSFKIDATDSSTGAGPFTQLQSYTWTINPPVLVINPLASSLPAAQVGVPYTETLTGSGGTAPYVSFLIIGGQLPAGLTLASNGVISGTPTSGGPFSITVQMSDSTTGTGPWTTSINYGLTVNLPNLGFAAQPAAQVGAAYSQAIVGAGGTAPYRFFSYAPGTGSAPFNMLPAGLTASAAGVISGTPTAGGAFNIMVTASDSSSGSGPYTYTQDLVLTVNAPSIVFTPNPMPAAQDGAVYSQSLTPAAGTAPYSNFFVASGALPSGLTLSNSGTISGTPTEGGAFNFVVEVTDSSTGTGPFTTGQNVSLTVNAPTFVFNPGPAGLTPAQVGAAGYSNTLTITGGTAPYSNFAVTSGALPAGMTLSNTGTLTGIPTAGGTFNFTVSATDSSSATNGGNGPYTEGQAYTLAVIAPSIALSPALLPNDQVGQPYSQTITGSGGTAPYSSFTISSGALPPGLTISPTGTISGVATGGGTYFFNVQAQDSSTGAGPYTYSQAYTLTSTKPTFTFSPATPANAQVGVGYFQAFSVTGGTAPYSNFILVVGALPGGLALSPSGFISGVPTSGGSFNFTVQAADSSTGVAPYAVPPAYTSSQSFTLVVTAPTFVFSPATLTTTAQAGVPFSQAFTVAGGTAPYGSFTLAAGTGSAPFNAAPAGLSFNPNTGVFSGTPTSSGTFTFVVLATDSSTNGGPYTEQSQVYTLTVNAPTLVFATTSLANAQAGVNLNLPLTITGGSAPYHLFTLTSGSLPAGVTLSGGGLLTGAPAAVGTFNFTVQGTDSTTGTGPYSISQAYTWTTTAPTVVLGPATLPTATDRRQLRRADHRLGRHGAVQLLRRQWRHVAPRPNDFEQRSHHRHPDFGWLVLLLIDGG